MVCLDKIKTNLDRWMSKPISVDGRISIIKMMVLPLTNLLTSMLSLSPPKGYWNKLHSLISEFIWNKKNKYQAWNVAEREISWRLGSSKLWNLPLIIYIWAWLDPSYFTSWCSLEAKLIHPCRLQDLIYTDTPTKQVRALFGPIVKNVLAWKLLTDYTHTNNKWRYHTPIFHNHNHNYHNHCLVDDQWPTQYGRIMGSIHLGWRNNII